MTVAFVAVDESVGMLKERQCLFPLTATSGSVFDIAVGEAFETSLEPRITGRRPCADIDATVVPSLKLRPPGRLSIRRRISYTRKIPMNTYMY